MDKELTNPYLAQPRDKDELRWMIREIMEQWPETKGYHVLVGSDPEEFGLPATSGLDGWSTIFPKKRILYVTGMAYWAKPAIMALGIFSFLSGWSEFILPLVLAPDNKVQVLSVYLAALIADDNNFDMALFKSVGVFYVVPVIILFLFFQNKLMTIYSGGTTG